MKESLPTSCRRLSFGGMPSRADLSTRLAHDWIIQITGLNSQWTKEILTLPKAGLVGRAGSSLALLLFSIGAEMVRVRRSDSTGVLDRPRKFRIEYDRVSLSLEGACDIATDVVGEETVVSKEAAESRLFPVSDRARRNASYLSNASSRRVESVSLLAESGTVGSSLDEMDDTDCL